MVICEKCFVDNEISSIIRSSNKATKGCCPVCGSPDVYLYNTCEQDELTGPFDELIGIFSPIKDSLITNVPKENQLPLIRQVVNRWRIFHTALSEKTIESIMRSICTQGSRDIFDGNVCIKEMYDECITTEKSMLYNSSWDRFVNDLKIKNRFHSDSLNLKILERFISYIPKKYKKGTHFYRARIGDSPNGYKVNEMSAPPASKSNEGRANAKGITCLYLASNLETTLHEVRATSYDYVSVGDFELKDDITVVDLKRLNQISPFIENLNVLDYAINQEYLDRLNKEMSKPLRRGDSVLDYVPTQYIIDYIKTIKDDGRSAYQGIEYTSTMSASGYNLAIFNPDLFCCKDVSVYEIKQLKYEYESL